MADQNPKPSLFSNLGAGSQAGTSSSPFSFGSSTGTPPTTTTTTTTTAGGSSLFGGNTTSGSNLFGSAAKKPEEGSKPTTSLFGNLQTPSKPSTSGPESLSTPANNTSAPGNPSTTPMFSPPAPFANLFGQQAGSSAQPASSSAAPTSLFGTVGSSAPKSTGSIFGQASSNPTSSNSLFGQKSNQTSQPQDKDKSSTGLSGAPSTTAATAGEQGKGPTLFGAATPAGSAGGQAPKPSLFGGAVTGATTASSSSPSFGSTAPAKPLFGAPASSSSAQPSQPAAPTAPSSNLFGGLQSNANQQSGGLGTPQKNDANISSGPASTGGTAAPSAAPVSLFGTPAPASQAQTSQAPSSQTAAATTTSLFGGLGKPAASTSAAPAASTQPTTSTSQITSGGEASAAASTSQPAAAATSTAPGTGAGGNAASTFGASTAGPAPTPQSRLKNKTMDDIITRWATDLKKYQKEFQTQAEKVAQWDRLLVENSNAITKLYSRTFQAERDTAEVQKQLSAVEDNQAELSQWLDRYEQEVESLMAKEGMGQREGLQGPDQERERTYKAAERVQEKLSDMGNELTGLVEEINAVSNSLSNSSKPDDPLSQIVRILNNHLSQLQQIDQDTAALQGKVAAAKAESQRLGYRNNGVNNAADDFYRSIRSGR